MTDTAVIVFARVPRLGRVKTRIAARVGEDRALAVHRALLERALQCAALVSEAWRELCIAGDDEAGECARLANSYDMRLTVQVGADLGERMFEALHRHTLAGRRVVLMGADCPWLEPHHLRRALELLQAHEQVFAPALDGGYVMVGSRCAHRDLFTGIDWGSSRVMAQTRDRLETLAMSAGFLQPLRDVDTWDDWQAWRADLRSTGAGAGDEPPRKRC